MKILQGFFQLNREFAERLLKYLPQGPPLAFEKYTEIVTHHLGQMEHPVILDVGGGRQCSFSEFRPRGSQLICLDISQEQLAHNKDADLLLLADVTREIPLPEASVDLVVSRAVMEHLQSPEAFLRHAYRVLKPGGKGIHVFPCKFAPFAMINGLMPAWLSQKVLFLFRPESSGGFPAFYRKCYYEGMRGILKKIGFITKEIYYSHSQAVYFDFFFPLFLLVALYEIMTLPFKNLASYMVIVVEKPFPGLAK